ncbi:hypothetical protein B0A49_12580, partial [Cryomyces minteri]
ATIAFDNPTKNDTLTPTDSALERMHLKMIHSNEMEGVQHVLQHNIQHDAHQAIQALSKLTLEGDESLDRPRLVPKSRRDVGKAPKAPLAIVQREQQRFERRRVIDSYRPVYKASEGMAEVDARSGGNRGYNNRKRRYREDDDFDRRPQRRRYEEPLASKIRKQLLSIAESPLKDPVEEAKDIAKALTDNYDDDELRNSFYELVILLTLEQPLKIPFTAAVVLYANDDKPELAKEVVTRVAAKAQSYLEAGVWRELKLLLRFLACMNGLFEGDGVFSTLEVLFDRAVDLQTTSSEDAIGLELVKVVLLTLPYLLATPGNGLEQKAVELLEKTEIIVTAPHILYDLVDPYPENGTDEKKPMACKSALLLLQNQLQKESSTEWELACIPRSYKRVEPAVDTVAEDGTTSTAAPAAAAAAKHAYPDFSVPSTINPGPKPLFPEVYFSLYADQDVKTVPPTTEIAASLVRDALVDTINILDFNRNATAKFLIDIDCYWAPNTFVKRATQFDKLRDVPADKPTWKPEDIAVDAVFSQIFQLPTPEHRLVYYHSIITESCKIAPAAIAPSLGRAIRFLFRSVDVMDLELAYRFMDWFAHHLSNFEFRWKWTEWLEDLNRSNLHPKKAFIVGALDKEIRLSFAKRIRDTIPEQYHPLIPEGKDKDVPDFKYADDRTPYSSEGKEILALLKKRAPESDVQQVINAIHEKAAALGVVDVLIPSTDAYVTAICYIGSKSLSHVLSCIERNKERLLAIGPASRGAQKQIITSVLEYWKDQPGIAVNIVDKLLNYAVITPMIVIEWAIVDHLDSGRMLAESYIYEMVSTTVFKVTNRIRQIIAARNQHGLPAEQVQMLDNTLTKERESMRELFAVIDDTLTGVATGANDAMIESFDGEEKEQEMLQSWGRRWLAVFRRKLAVEEAVVGEAAVGPLPESVHIGNGNGDVEGNGSAVAVQEIETDDIL